MLIIILNIILLNISLLVIKFLRIKILSKKHFNTNIIWIKEPSVTLHLNKYFN